MGSATVSRSSAISRGVSFLRSVQLSNGSFESFSSPKKTPFTPKKTYITTFASAIILEAIGTVDSARDVRERIAIWLLAQKSSYWSFNYWALDAPERETLPYPDDLDDTFCSLLALQKHNPSLVSQEALAKVVKLLICAEIQAGGPYRTWLVAKSTPDTWQDVDLAINANIAAFLRQVAQPLPNLNAMMEKAIAQRDFHSSYYPSFYPVVYYIARAYDKPYSSVLVAHILSKRRNGWWGTPLQTALAISALSKLGHTDGYAVAAEKLMAAQSPDGSWPAETFCIDPAIDNRKYYNGAPAITTAFAIQALCSLSSHAQPTSVSAKREDKLHDSVISLVQKEIDRMPQSLQSGLKVALNHIKSGDNGREITTLAHEFNNSFIRAAAAPTNRLGAANVFGWIAYTIYDDFLDGEGKPELLSAANAAQRKSLELFRVAAPSDSNFASSAAMTFDQIDAANAWEFANCRAKINGKKITINDLPEYEGLSALSNRSLGHTLPARGVLAVRSFDQTDPSCMQIQQALENYIIARQLNDDIHDWQDDIRAGIITYVVAEILNALNIKHGTYSLNQLIPKMQKEFWRRTLPEICQTILKHTKLSREQAVQSQLLKDDNVITQLTDRIDRSIQMTLREQSKAEEFLTAYSQSSD